MKKIKKEERNKKMKGKKGITLIALIITIIVMLVLVAVTINVAISSGLFNTAKRAVRKMQEKRDEELASWIVCTTEPIDDDGMRINVLIMGLTPLTEEEFINELANSRTEEELKEKVLCAINYLGGTWEEYLTENDMTEGQVVQASEELGMTYKQFLATVAYEMEYPVYLASGETRDLTVDELKSLIIKIEGCSTFDEVLTKENMTQEQYNAEINNYRTEETALKTVISNNGYNKFEAVVTCSNGESKDFDNEIGYTWFDVFLSGDYIIQVINDGTTVERTVKISTLLQSLPNSPKLMTGMTPIKWDSAGNVVETTADDTTWYDYGNKRWANAKTGDGSMWVWIPRFAYSIPGDGTNGYHTSNAVRIRIKFLEGKTDVATDGTTTIWDNESGPGNWNIHPAFKFGEEELEGIWVAKFEASHSDSTASEEGTSETMKIQPGVPSWRSITVNDIFTKCKEYNEPMNSHMMKNSEWGAVAYLAQSQYGVNREVYINNSSGHYTGRSGGNVGGRSRICDAYADLTTLTMDCNRYGFYTWDGYLLDYDTNTKSSTRDETKVASTTGNVTGIYDMSGGAYEYVAAYVPNFNDSLRSYGNSLVDETDGRYKDVYEVADTDEPEANYSKNSSILR